MDQFPDERDQDQHDAAARLAAKVPHGRSTTVTYPAALRSDRITAPCVVDGPINGESFRVPTLAPGDGVIMDNLASHREKGGCAAMRALGPHLLFLPPCSPDLNPIEQVFAKLKHLRREAAGHTADATWLRIGALLHRFSPQECANCLVNAGYAST